MSGCFVLYDLSQNLTRRYNPAGCAQRFLPASTFKILNALIALETGVIPDPDYPISWDGTHYPTASWNRDQTARSAMRDSVVWYYQELARRIGAERMQDYVNRVGYGNRDISGQIDSFWLVGGLRISPDEQIDFLRRLAAGTLPFSSRSQELVRGMLVVEAAPNLTLRAKTGWTELSGVQIGWYVGYVERGGRLVFFALNIESPQATTGFIDGREGITRDILKAQGLLD